MDVVCALERGKGGKGKGGGRLLTARSVLVSKSPAFLTV